MDNMGKNKEKRLSLSIHSDNIGLTSSIQTVSRKLGLTIVEKDGNISVIDLESQVGTNPRTIKSRVKIFAGTLKTLKNFLKMEKTEDFEYIIIPAELSEVEAILRKSINLIKLQFEVNHALKESLEYYTTFLEMKKSLKFLEISDPDLKTEEILNFLELEIGETNIEIWLYDFDEKTLNLAGIRGTYIAEEKLPSGIKEKFTPEGNPITYENGTLLPLTNRGKIFGIIRFRKKLNETELKKLQIYREFLSMALFNSLKYFYQKREISTFAQKGVLKKEVLLEFIKKGLHQSRRYSNPISFLLFRLENKETLMKLFGDTVGKKWKKFINDIAQTLRASDVIGEINSDSYLIILTSTDYMGVIYFLRRFKNILRTHSIFSKGGKTGELVVKYNIASYPVTGTTWTELESTLFNGLNDKYNPFFGFKIGNLSFPEVVDYLRSVIMKNKLQNKEELAPRFWGINKSTIITQIETFIREMISHGNRGIGYINLPWFKKEEFLDLLEKYLDAGNDTAFPVFFFTNKMDIPAKTGYGRKYIIAIDNEILMKYGFIILLSHWGSYLHIFWKDEDLFPGIHCSDTLLVEEVVEKLQRFLYLKPPV